MSSTTEVDNSIFDDKSVDTDTFIHTTLAASTDQTPSSLPLSFSSEDLIDSLPSALSSSDSRPSWARTLPNLSAVMDLSRDPWTNERIRVQSSVATLGLMSQRSIMTPTVHTTNLLAESLIIPGEPVLCKTRAREKTYWPARLIGCERSSRRGTGNPTEELYCVLFCDGIRMVVPRSFFLTSFQEAFKTVKLGELETTEVTFEQILPKLMMETGKLDAIISGLNTERSVTNRHEDYLTRTPEVHTSVAEDISYGQYPESTVLGVIEHLRDRYISQISESLKITADPRFFTLTEENKHGYLLEVILPEAMILITQQDFLDEATDTSHARSLAIESLNTPDIVSLITRLRKSSDSLS